MSTWEVEHDRTNVVCPDCAFSFDAIHQDGDGGYTCPLCEPAPAPGEPSGAEAQYRISGAAIRDRRVAAGMSLRELAAAVGIGNVEMGEIERGIRLPDANTATAIREAINAASGSGADAAVREAYAVIDELAPQWSGSSIASVLRAYLERMAVPYPWRPIETAPKDGSRVLLAGCGENGGWVCVASWRGGRWRDGDYSIEPPTHWMPLPTAPGAPEEGAGE